MNNTKTLDTIFIDYKNQALDDLFNLVDARHIEFFSAGEDPTDIENKAVGYLFYPEFFSLIRKIRSHSPKAMEEILDKFISLIVVKAETSGKTDPNGEYRILEISDTGGTIEHFSYKSFIGSIAAQLVREANLFDPSLEHARLCVKNSWRHLYLERCVKEKKYITCEWYAPRVAYNGSHFSFAFNFIKGIYKRTLSK